MSLEGLNPTAITSLSLGCLPGLSSLAGLSALQCLRELRIETCAGITSLGPLSRLPSLQDLVIGHRKHVPSLVGVMVTHLGLPCVDSLAGTQTLASCLKSLSCGSLHDLKGVEELTELQKVELRWGGFTSLQPLAVLQHLRELTVLGCGGVVESILVLPHFPPSGSINVIGSRVTVVVLAGGVHMAVGSGPVCC
jgi:hypothetical protein